MDMERLMRKMDSAASGDSTDHDRAMKVLSGLDREVGSDPITNDDVYAMVKENQEFTNNERGLRTIIGSKSKQK